MSAGSPNYQRLAEMGKLPENMRHMVSGLREIDENKKKYVGQDIVFVIQPSGVILLCLENDSTYLRDIKYVHQLQNLYFALTGEELTIKQKP